MAQNTPLTPKQQRLVEALLAGNSVLVAAKASGINRSTAQRWMKDANFQAHYQEAKARMFDSRLDELEEDVFTALVKHIRADTRPSGWTQLAALRLWFDMKGESGRMRELEQEFEEWRMSQKQRGDDEQLEDLG